MATVISPQDAPVITPHDKIASELRLTVTGMTCAACVRRVEKALLRVPGVTGAQVNLVTERAIVQGNSVDVATLLSSVERAGYAATPLADTPDSSQTIDAAEAARTHLLRDRARRWLVGALLTLPILILHTWYLGVVPGVQWVLLALTTPVWWYTGAEFHRGALAALRQHTTNMDVLVSLGASAAYALSWMSTVWPWLTGGIMAFDATALILTFVSLGKWLEARARHRAAAAITRLLSLQPQEAHVLRAGKVWPVPLAMVRGGDRLQVYPGERMPVDGNIVAGTTAIDASLVTGESLPVTKTSGDAVVGGTLNLTGSVEIVATQVGQATILAGIVRAVERAQTTRAPIQRVADRVAAVFVPVMLSLAALTTIGWGLAFAHGAHPPGLIALGPAALWVRALIAGITVLVVACPCALGLATPIALIAGTSRGAAAGILIKDAAVLEQAERVTTIVLDKTGTITQGHPSVQRIIPVASPLGERRHQAPPTTAAVLRWAAIAAAGSTHPLSQAVTAAYHAQSGEQLPTSTSQEIAGQGVVAAVEGHSLLLGNARLLRARHLPMKSATAACGSLERAGITPLFVACDGICLGLIGIADSVRAEAATAVVELQQRYSIWMVSGDTRRVAHAVAAQVGIAPEHVVSEASPTTKAGVIRRMQRAGEVVAFVGDGSNDAPALATADVGIALGTGTDIAGAAGTITLVDGSLQGVSHALKLSGRTLRIIRQNLAWAFGYNLVMVPLAILSPPSRWSRLRRRYWPPEQWRSLR